MPRQRTLYTKKALHQWTTEITQAFPHLSKPQAAVLALGSFGMVLARSCSLTTVAFVRAQLLHLKPGSVGQRWREFYQEALPRVAAHTAASAKSWT